MVGGGLPATAGEEVLTDEQRRFEALALRLRTPAGVPAHSLPDDPDLEGLVERSDGRAVLTVRGRLLANAVSTRLRVGGGPATPVGADGWMPAGTIPPYA
jgi:hypothetical protein